MEPIPYGGATWFSLGTGARYLGTLVLPQSDVADFVDLAWEASPSLRRGWTSGERKMGGVREEEERGTVFGM